MTEQVAAHRSRTELWDGRYTTTGPTQVSWYTPDMLMSVALLERAGLSPASAVVDVGGGASVLVDHLLDKGVADVTVVDVSAAALAAAQDRLGERASQVEWVRTDLLEWVPGSTWDLWHDRAVFNLLNLPHEVAAYVSLAARSIAPGGHLALATFSPDGPSTCSGLPVARAVPAELADAFAAHFDVAHSAHEDHLTPSGSTQPFSWVLLRRRDD